MKNKCILLTGATGLIGKELLAHFVKKGYTMVITTRNISKVASFLNESYLEKYSSKIIPIECDFMNYDAVRLIKELSEKHLKIKAIIHNARSIDSLRIENNGTSSQENLLMEYQIGVAVPYRITMDIIQAEQYFGVQNIVFISSMYGVVAPTPSLYDDFELSSPIQYGLTKAAQIHLTKELAVRLAKYNIRVNSVSYGGIKGRATTDFMDRYEKRTPLGGMLDREDVVGPVNFLLSNDSKKMTGHNLIYDGGWTIW